MTKVNKNILIGISGAMWTLVGIFLFKIAIFWLLSPSNTTILSISILASGSIAGVLIAKFGFNKIAEKNINRIKEYKKEVCLFAFQNWQSYLLIIFMISLGILLKSASFIPKNILAVMYFGIGFALFLASFRYYINLYKCLKLKK